MNDPTLTALERHKLVLQGRVGGLMILTGDETHRGFAFVTNPVSTWQVYHMTPECNRRLAMVDTPGVPDTHLTYKVPSSLDDGKINLFEAVYDASLTGIIVPDTNVVEGSRHFIMASMGWNTRSANLPDWKGLLKAIQPVVLPDFNVLHEQPLQDQFQVLMLPVGLGLPMGMIVPADKSYTQVSNIWKECKWLSDFQVFWKEPKVKQLIQGWFSAIKSDPDKFLVPCNSATGLTDLLPTDENPSPMGIKSKEAFSPILDLWNALLSPILWDRLTAPTAGTIDNAWMANVYLANAKTCFPTVDNDQYLPCPLHMAAVVKPDVPWGENMTTLVNYMTNPLRVSEWVRNLEADQVPLVEIAKTPLPKVTTPLLRACNTRRRDKRKRKVTPEELPASQKTPPPSLRPVPPTGTLNGGFPHQRSLVHVFDTPPHTTMGSTASQGIEVRDTPPMIDKATLPPLGRGSPADNTRSKRQQTGTPGPTERQMTYVVHPEQYERGIATTRESSATNRRNPASTSWERRLRLFLVKPIPPCPRGLISCSPDQPFLKETDYLEYPPLPTSQKPFFMDIYGTSQPTPTHYNMIMAWKAAEVATGDLHLEFLDKPFLKKLFDPITWQMVVNKPPPSDRENSPLHLFAFHKILNPQWRNDLLPSEGYTSYEARTLGQIVYGALSVVCNHPEDSTDNFRLTLFGRLIYDVIKIPDRSSVAQLWARHQRNVTGIWVNQLCQVLQLMADYATSLKYASKGSIVTKAVAGLSEASRTMEVIPISMISVARYGQLETKPRTVLGEVERIERNLRDTWFDNVNNHQHMCWHNRPNDILFEKGAPPSPPAPYLRGQRQSPQITVRSPLMELVSPPEKFKHRTIGQWFVQEVRNAHVEGGKEVFPPKFGKKNFCFNCAFMPPYNKCTGKCHPRCVHVDLAEDQWVNQSASTWTSLVKFIQTYPQLVRPSKKFKELTPTTKW